ncbi:MAG: Ig-like domain-containing protein [Christensenellaceae bacterium]|jgi:hypothetical protein|nr:Ig-like domain-containing protein [Christensenellaceae bacterium]
MTIKKKLLISLLIVIPTLVAIGLGIYFIVPKAPAITAIRLQPEINVEYVYINEPFNINAALEPENADKGRLVWYSSNENIATVDSNGRVTPVAAGFVTITAISKDTSNVKSSISFSVRNLSRQLEMNPLTVTYDGNAHQTYVDGWSTANGNLVYKFTGTLSGGEYYTSGNEPTRDAPTDAGIYRVYVELEGTADSNYTTLKILPKPISITIGNFQKEYLDPNPTFNYNVTGLVGSEQLIFEILGGTNENVAIYTLSPQTQIFAFDEQNYITSLVDTSAGKYNYTLSSISNGTLTIAKKPIRIKAIAKTSIYGEALSPLEFEIYNSTNTLLNDSRFYSSVLGLLTVNTGGAMPSAGTYTISTGSLTSNNLDITATEDASYIVTKRVISVYPGAGGQKFAGAADPVFGYSLGNNTVNDGVVFGNLLLRSAGELVGTYAYHLTGGSIVDGEEINSAAYQNYTLKLVSTGHIFSILQNVVQIGMSNLYETYDPLQSYIQNTVLTGTITYTLFINGVQMNPNINSSGIELVSGDRFSIMSLLGVEDLVTTPSYDTYKIYSATVAQKFTNFQDNFTVGGGGSLDINKYDIYFGSSKMFIQKIVLTLTVNLSTKVYGDVDPAFSYLAGGFISSDTAINSITSVTYTRTDSGTKTNNTVGEYSVNISSAGINKAYYKPVFVPGVLTITPMDISLNTIDYTRPYGAVVPDFRYSFVDVDNDEIPDITLPYGDTDANVATGSLIKSLSGTADGLPGGTPTSGENVGVYNILDTTLIKNANYNILYTAKKYTITKRQVTLAPLNLNIVYGDSVPELLYTAQVNTTSYSYNLESPLLSLSGTMRLSATSGSYTPTTSPLVARTYYFDQNTLALGSNFQLQFDASSSSFIVSPLPVTLSFITKTFTGSLPSDSEAIVVFSSSRGNGLAYSDAVSSLVLTLTNAPPTLHYIDNINDIAITIQNGSGTNITSSYNISLNDAMNIVFAQGVANLNVGIIATAISGDNTTTKPFSGSTPWTFDATLISPPAGLYIDPSSISFRYLYPSGQLLSVAPKNAGSYLVTLDISSLIIRDSSSGDADVTALYSPMVSAPVTVSITPIDPTITTPHTLSSLIYGTPYTYVNGKHDFAIGTEITGSFNVPGTYYTLDNSALTVGSSGINVTFVPDTIADTGGQFKNYNNYTMNLMLTINPFSITMNENISFSYVWTDTHPTYTNSTYPNTITNLKAVLGEAYVSAFAVSYAYYGFTFNSNGSITTSNPSEPTIFLERLGEPTFTIENDSFVATYPNNKKITLSIFGILNARYYDGANEWDIANIYSSAASPRAAGFYISAATLTANNANVTLEGQVSQSFFSGYTIKKAGFTSFTPNTLQFEYLTALNLETCVITPNPSGVLITTLGYSLSSAGPFNSTAYVYAGTYYVKLEANQTNHYSTDVFQFKIDKAHISATLLAPTNFGYDGIQHQPNYRLVWGEVFITSLQIAELMSQTIPSTVWQNEGQALIDEINLYLTSQISHIKQAIILKEIITAPSTPAAISIVFGGTQNDGTIFSGSAAPENAGNYIMNIVLNCSNIAGGNSDLPADSKRFYINPKNSPDLGITFVPTNVAKDKMANDSALYAHIIDSMIVTNSPFVSAEKGLMTDIKAILKEIYSQGFILSDIANRKFEVTYLYDDDNNSSTPLIATSEFIYINISIMDGLALIPTNGTAWYNAINGSIGTKTLALSINFVGGNIRKIDLTGTITVNRITLERSHFVEPHGASYNFINADIWAPLQRGASSPISSGVNFTPEPTFNGNEVTYQEANTVTIRYSYSQGGTTMTHAPREVGTYTVTAIVTSPPTSYYIISDSGSLTYSYTIHIIPSTIVSDIPATVHAPFKNAPYNATYMYEVFETYNIKTGISGDNYNLTFSASASPEVAQNGLTFRVFFNSYSPSVTDAGTYIAYLELVGNFGGNIVDITSPFRISFNFVIDKLSLGETTQKVLDHIQNTPFAFTYPTNPNITLNALPYNNAIDNFTGTLSIAYFTDNDDNDPFASLIDTTGGKSVYDDPNVTAGTIYFRIISSHASIAESTAVAITLNKETVLTTDISIDSGYISGNEITGYYFGGQPVEVDKTKLSVTTLPEAEASDFVVEYYLFIANEWKWTPNAPTGVGQYDIRISLNARWYQTGINEYKTGITFVVTMLSIVTSPIEFDYGDFAHAEYEDTGTYFPIIFYDWQNAASSAPLIHYEGTLLSGWWLFSEEDINAFLTDKPSSMSLYDYGTAMTYISSLSNGDGTYANILSLLQINSLSANTHTYTLYAVFVCDDPDVGALLVPLECTVNKKYIDLSGSIATFNINDVTLTSITKSGGSWTYTYDDISLSGEKAISLGTIAGLVLGESTIEFTSLFTITSYNIFTTFNNNGTIYTPSSLILDFESQNYRGPIKLSFNLNKSGLETLFYNAELSRPFTNDVIASTYYTNLLDKLFYAPNVNADAKANIVSGVTFTYESTSGLYVAHIAGNISPATYTYIAVFGGNQYYATTNLQITYEIEPLIINPVLSAGIITDTNVPLTVTLNIVSTLDADLGLDTLVPTLLSTVLDSATVADSTAPSVTILTQSCYYNAGVWTYVFNLNNPSALPNGTYWLTIPANFGMSSGIFFGTSSASPTTMPIPFVVDNAMDITKDIGAVFFGDSLSSGALLSKLENAYNYTDGQLDSAEWLNSFYENSGAYLETGGSGTIYTNTNNYLLGTNYIISPLSVAPLYYTYLKNTEKDAIAEDIGTSTTIQDLINAGYATYWDLTTDGIYFGLNGGGGSHSLATGGTLNFVDMPVRMIFTGGGEVIILVSFTLYFDFAITYNDNTPYVYSSGVSQGPDKTKFNVLRQGFKYTNSGGSNLSGTATVVSMSGASIGNNVSVSYSQSPHINAGSYTATATYTPGGNYGQPYSLTVPFVIEKQPLAITMTNQTISYGDNFSTSGWATSSEGSNFTYTWNGLSYMPTDAGKYTIKAEWTGNSNYTGITYATLTILPITPTVMVDPSGSQLDPTEPKIKIDNVSYSYSALPSGINAQFFDAENYIPGSSLAQGLPLVAGNNYIVVVNINKGVTYNDNFLPATFSIGYSIPPEPPIDPEEYNLWIEITNTVHVYDGSAKAINAVLMNGDAISELIASTDYTINIIYYLGGSPINTGLNPIIDAGYYAAVITVTFISEPYYTDIGLLTRDTTMVIQKTYFDVDTGSVSATYNTGVINHNIVYVKNVFDTSLVLNTDYTVSIANSSGLPASMQNAGIYTITIAPISGYATNYEPYIFKFTIAPYAVSFTLGASSINGSTYDGTNKTVTVDWSAYETAFGIITKPNLNWSGAVFVSPSSIGASVVAAGNYTVSATINDANFVGTTSVQFVIQKKQITLSQTKFEAYWLPDITWTTVLDNASFNIGGIIPGDTLNVNSLNFNLTVNPSSTWGSFIQDVKTYQATITCIHTNYTGSLMFNFKINQSTVKVMYDTSVSNNGQTLVDINDITFKSHTYTPYDPLNDPYEHANFFEFGRLKYIFNGNTAAPVAIISGSSLINISTEGNIFTYTNRGTPSYSPLDILSAYSYRVNNYISLFILTASLNSYANSNNMQFDINTDVFYITVW